MFKKIQLSDFNFDIFLNADYTQHTGSCINHQVHELTDIHTKYGGFPTSYCLENTMIHQLWWTKEQIDFEDLGNKLGIDVVTVSSILQPPGCVVPLHRDTFYQINKKYPERQDHKVRANIFLENYKVGHFVQYLDENQKIYTVDNWDRGDGYIWDSEILHLSCNAGMQDKYTLQVSGFLKQDN
jgi:hypothetical protein